MPKRAIAAIAVTAIALALLFSFKTPADQAAALGLPALGSLAPGPVSPTDPGVASSPPQPGATQPPPASPAPTKVARKGNGTYTGSAVEEPFGVIQVQATVANGKLTGVTVVQMPTHGRSGFISAQAAPILQGEAISAQSANIDSVSGATYTSQAYAQSLQSALDQAGI
jgi:uncharacterized protein with FMN-binding domain